MEVYYWDSKILGNKIENIKIRNGKEINNVTLNKLDITVVEEKYINLIFLSQTLLVTNHI